jgi:pimeloyl-ACP methyl ester carboxylesterase
MNANLYLRTPRLIGVLMLSLLDIHVDAFDDLPVMYLNQTPPMTYGITAMASMAPRDYRTAFEAIQAPLLLIAGNKDEVFRGTAYKDVVETYSRGRSVLVDGATHTSVLGDPAAIGEIKAFIESLDKSLNESLNESLDKSAAQRSE